jgi:general secretion pathway protein F
VPVYNYKGVTEAGRSTRGLVDAENDRLARVKLRRDGIFLTELTASRGGRTPASAARGAPRRSSFEWVRPISQMDLAIATRQLATLVGAGIPLVESLGALTEQVESQRLKGVLGRVRERVNEGAGLGDAMAQSGPFSDLYVSMVRAGESSGALEQVLGRLADYLESQVRTRNKVVSILVYPIVMVFVSIAVVVFLLTFVIPKITVLLESLDQELPVLTVFVIGASEIVRDRWWLLLGIAIAAFFAFRSAIATQRGRRALDALKLRLPVFGKVTRQVAIARFSRTLSTLLAGGIPIVKALEISKHVANNAVIGEAVDAARDAITEGASVAAPLRASGQFPPLVTHMVDVGERSGELEGMLGRVADAYDEQVENSISRLTALLEPALILIMVGVVLVILLASLQPVLRATSAIG